MRLKKILILILNQCFIKRLFKPFYAGKGSILFMHKVIEKRTARSRILMMTANEIEVDYLEEMIVYLKKKYDIIAIDEIQERLTAKKKFKKKFIVFTFDDGYKDNLTLAYPLFKKHNVPFTIYITNGFPNKTAQLWWYMLEEIILENSKLTLRLPKKELNFNLRSQQEKEKAFDKIRNLIINQSDHNNSIIKNLEKEYNKKLKTYVYRESLTWEELQDFSKDSLLTVGFHTMNHLALNKLSEENLNSEVLDSKTEIECKIGKPICHFAYPYGTKNEINLREVSALKMMPEVSTSVTTRLGNIFTAHKNHLHSLPRIQVLGTEQNISILELYLSGVLPAIKNKFKRVLTI